MMCHLDKTSCSCHNTAAHFGVDAGSAAAAAQKRILEWTRGPWRRRRDKKMSREMFGRVAVKNMKSTAKYPLCLCNPSTGVLCLHKQR